MIKVYTAPEICKDCRDFEKIIESRGLKVEKINIIENTTNLKKYLAYRDTSLDFIEIKKNGTIGIPFFEKEDGQITFYVNEALAWMGEKPLTPEEKGEEPCEDCNNIWLRLKNKK